MLILMFGVQRMSTSIDVTPAHWGLIGFVFGVAALCAAVVLTSGMLAPVPEQSVGTLIGEMARDIRNAATGVASAPVENPTMDLDALLAVLTPVLAVIAAVLGGISLFRHEPTALPKLAIGLGISAFVMQYAFWMAMLICGTVLLVAIVSNIGDILGG